MPTEVLQLNQEGNYRESLRRAAEALRDGRLVGFPTETVYGIAARADSAEAIAALRRVKERDEGKPFTVHVGGVGDLKRYVPNVNNMGRRFVRRAWPGPVTIVFSVPNPEASPVIQACGVEHLSRIYHENTVGIRCPSDPVAMALLEDAGVPVVAASANRAGARPPHNAEEVIAELDGSLDLLLDGGRTRFSQASTVVRLTEHGFETLRTGVIDDRTLRRYTGLRIVFVCSGNTCRSPMAEALCRGMLAKRFDCKPDELEKRNVFVDSMGASGFDGSPASEGAIHAMRERGLDLSRHRARALDRELLSGADNIFCMTRAHQIAVTEAVPSVSERVQLLAEGEEIADPFGGSNEQYESCAGAIETALAKRLEEVLA